MRFCVGLLYPRTQTDWSPVRGFCFSLSRLEILIQRDSVISWPSHSSSCYLSLPLLPTSLSLSGCCFARVIQRHLFPFSPSPPLHLPVSAPALCALANVFVCRDVKQDPLSDLHFLPAQAIAGIFCVCACRMLSELLSYFHCRCSLLLHTHTHTHTHKCTRTHALESEVTIWIRFLRSAPEGQKIDLLFLLWLVMGICGPSSFVLLTLSGQVVSRMKISS